MESIEAIQNEPGKIFRIECRATSGQVRETKTGKLFTPFKLEDMTGELTGYLPVNPGSQIFRLKPGSRTIVLVKIEEWSGHPIARVLEVLPLNGPMFPARCLPRSWCPLPELLPDLADCIDSLTYMPLIQFMEGVLNDDAIMKPFLSIPASIDNHHSYAGGLLVHSLECAARVHNFLAPDADAFTTELSMIAALLHDIGKIRTLTPDMQYQDSSLLLRHDEFTREVLAPHLCILEEWDRDAANALRYLLGWHETTHGRSPKIPSAMVIKMADRYSAAKDAAKMAFSRAPKWMKLVPLKGRGPKRTYWRSLRRDAAYTSVCRLTIPA